MPYNQCIFILNLKPDDKVIQFNFREKIDMKVIQCYFREKIDI